MFIAAMVFNLLAAILFVGSLVFIHKNKVNAAFTVVVLALAVASVAGFCRSNGLEAQEEAVRKCETALLNK